MFRGLILLLPLMLLLLAVPLGLRAQEMDLQADALTQAFTELKLPEEKVFFDQDVLTQPNIFFQTGNSVDKEKLRNFLEFTSDNIFKDKAKACVFTHSEEDCELCRQMEPFLQKSLQDFLANRGFIVNAGGVLSLSGCRLKIQAEVARSHSPNESEDEVELLASAKMSIVGNASIQPEANTNFLIATDFESQTPQIVQAAAPSSALKVTRVLAAGFMNVSKEKMRSALTVGSSSKPGSAAIVGMRYCSGGDDDEKILTLDVVNDFSTYTLFKETVVENIPGIDLQERAVAPGVVQFAVQGFSGSFDLLGKQIESLPWGSHKVRILPKEKKESPLLKSGLTVVLK
jgi:hypothetical protein